MPIPRVPLTRSTLLQTQRSLTVARQGYDLLDRKREILLAELTAVTPQAEAARDALLQAIDRACAELADARMAVGAERIRWAALAAPAPPEIRITERSIVGAVVPVIRCEPPAGRPRYSAEGTAPEVDLAARAFSDLIEKICRAAETESTVMRLAGEIRKTQRRVNALRNVVIPTQEAIIKMVREALEDVEREAFFTAKRIRSRIGRP